LWNLAAPTAAGRIALSKRLLNLVAGGFFALGGLGLPALHAQPMPQRDVAGAALTPAAKPVDPTTDLGNAQSLRLRFSDFPNLTGEYRVGADYTIAIPAVGRISVRGLNSRSFEETIAQKVSAASGRQSFVAVEILEYRPVFVTGSVGRPGPVPWQPKMTVLQAIASAGGIYRATTGSGGVNVRRAVDDQKRWLASYARVQAELKDAARIELPKRLVELAGEADAATLIDEQSKVMAQRRNSLESQLKVIAENQRVLGMELDSLKEQRQKLEEQIRLRQERSQKLEQLFNKGLAVADVTLQQKLELATLEERLAGASVSIARVQTSIANGERDRANLINTRRNELFAEAQNLDRSITQNEFDLPRTSLLAASSSKAPGYAYTVARANDEDQPDVSASPSTDLFPGDVLTVSERLQ
jgi:protein involved in polysaccharide export with SLBB domain